jgi:nitrite reductase/ring-hydroxylating ferredoxin subunit
LSVILTANTDLVTLCPFDELPDGSARDFDPFSEARDEIFVVRRGDTLNAYRNVCPHQRSSRPWREDADLDLYGTYIVCSAQGAQFDVNTGASLRGAALGKSLESIDISLTPDGLVQARL